MDHTPSPPPPPPRPRIPRTLPRERKMKRGVSAKPRTSRLAQKKGLVWVAYSSRPPGVPRFCGRSAVKRTRLWEMARTMKGCRGRESGGDREREDLVKREEREEEREENKRRVARFFEIAQRKGCTGAQLALAWVHARGADVFPIPGTKSAARIEENAQALHLSQQLTAEELMEIEQSITALAGDRYPETMMKSTFNDRL